MYPIFPASVKWYAVLFLLTSILSTVALSASNGSEISQRQEDYKLGTGDRIRIHVFQEADLSVEVRVGDTGTISYPFLGEIQIAGLSIKQVEDKLTRGLKGDYLINPRVSVSVAEYRQFFVNGEVKRPGAYPYVPGLTVRKAISFSGGFAERADKSNIFVLHENSPGGKPGRVALDDELRPGDILTVEQSFF